MRGLFGLAVAEPGEVLFDDLALFHLFLEEFRIAGYSRTGVVGDIEISRAAVAGKMRIVDRAALGIFCGEFLGGLDRAAEFDACSMIMPQDFISSRAGQSGQWCGPISGASF